MIFSKAVTTLPAYANGDAVPEAQVFFHLVGAPGFRHTYDGPYVYECTCVRAYIYTYVRLSVLRFFFSKRTQQRNSKQLG